MFVNPFVKLRCNTGHNQTQNGVYACVRSSYVVGAFKMLVKNLMICEMFCIIFIPNLVNLSSIKLQKNLPIIPITQRPISLPTNMFNKHFYNKLTKWGISITV